MTTSCEPDRCSAYSDDLRWRMVYQRTALGLTYREIAANLCVDFSTVCRTVQAFECSGNVSKKEYNAASLPRKLTEVVELLIMQLVLQNVGITLTEIRKEILYMSGVDLSLSTICKFLQKHKFSRQRIKYIAAQRDEYLRQIYVSDVLMYNADMFIFCDETGTDGIERQD